jgi:soluble lytic murein transglycosylase-like protein
MKTATGLLLAATIGVAAAGCTSMTDLSTERVLDIQSTRVAAYIPAGTGQSSVSTYSSPTHAELSSERILDIHSTRAAAFIPTATSQLSAPTRAASTRVASTRASKTARSKSKSGKSSIHNLVGKHARAAGVPVKLALAVVQVESNFNPRARGQAGEVGLMQIKPATARGIGYKGSIKALYNPSTNLIWGMKYLAEARRRGGGSVCGTILKYNGGHYAKRMNKISSRYCGKVKLIMRKTA